MDPSDRHAWISGLEHEVVVYASSLVYSVLGGSMPPGPYIYPIMCARVQRLDQD